MKRDMERIEAERDCAREEAHKCVLPAVLAREATCSLRMQPSRVESDARPPAHARAGLAKGQIEDRCSAVRKEADQQMRDVQARISNICSKLPSILQV